MSSNNHYNSSRRVDPASSMDHGSNYDDGPASSSSSKENMDPRLRMLSKSGKGLGLAVADSVMTDGISRCDVGPACYLVYETDSSGRLVEHFSTEPCGGALGRWTAGPSRSIAPFKFKRNAGRNVLIGNCSAGVLGRKNFCSGWCQFVRSAVVLGGEVTLFDIPRGYKAMAVDVYLYFDDDRSAHQTKRLIPGEPVSTDGLLAVACIPKSTLFYENMRVGTSDVTK
jgi:Immune Mapped Protein 2 (IMP2) N-terminal domain